jgi:hypothetical protein
VVKSRRLRRAAFSALRVSPAARLLRVAGMAIVLVIVALVEEAGAHGVSGKDAVFLQSIKGAAIGPFLYLGAK